MGGGMIWDAEKEINEEHETVRGAFQARSFWESLLIHRYGGSWPSPLPPKGRRTVFLAFKMDKWPV